MKYITAFGRFWYDFLVGDDWTIAVAVVVAVALTALLSRVTSAAWIVMVVAVAASVLGQGISSLFNTTANSV